MQEYLTFDMAIGQGNREHYPVRVRSPEGETEAFMHFPLNQQALREWRVTLQQALLLSGSTHRSLSREEQLVQGFGGFLFRALFTNQVM